MVYAIFALGVFFLEAHTTLAVLWTISGLPGTYPLSRSAVLYYAQGFTPMIGALLLLVAGLVYEKLETTP